MNALSLKVRLRDGLGTGEAGRLRRQGLLPAVLYGNRKPNRNVLVNEHDLMMLLQGHASEHVMLDLDVEGEGVCKALLQDVQHHPVTGRILHLDFHEVSMTDRIRMEVPVHLVGQAIGVTRGGGLLEHLTRTVEVECLPNDVVERFDLDVSGLELGHSLFVSDLPIDAAKYDLLTEPDVALVSVHAPRVDAEKAEEEGAEGAGKSPEVIREKKEAEGEEGK